MPKILNKSKMTHGEVTLELSAMAQTLSYFDLE
jgi:hypothetical protein